MPEPSPISMIVCDICGESWEEHERYRTWGDEHLDIWERLGRRDIEARRALLEANPLHGITVLTCVTVLKNRFRGPEGPVGPQGVSGRDADA